MVLKKKTRAGLVFTIELDRAEATGEKIQLKVTSISLEKAIESNRKQTKKARK